MARVDRRRSENVPGEFFVDSTCIDCRACEWIAPDSFSDHGGMARVYRQPSDRREFERCLMALLSCPVSAIGSLSKHDLREVEALYPEPIEGSVFTCGYHSPKSYGAASYLIVRPQGNILVDSPRFSKPLVDRLESMGGVSFMVLTHADDVADHEKFHRHFGCVRVLHEDDSDQDTRKSEILLSGTEAMPLTEDALLIPVPGHTKGSLCVLYPDRYLFTGDHLSWSPLSQSLRASRRTCWYDWDRQICSMERLAAYRFEWILPGHGWRIHLQSERMKMQLERCLSEMKKA